MTQSLNASAYDVTGKVADSFELPVKLFDVEVSIPLVHQVVNTRLAAAHQGARSTKIRGEVSGGGKKPFKQKGTDRVRQGSIRAPQLTGGDIVHGPKPRDYSQRTPKKMIITALCQPLSDRVCNEHIHVVKAFLESEKPSTKTVLGLLRKMIDDRATLVTVSRGDDLMRLPLRNTPEVSAILAGQFNSYNVLVADDVVFTESALVEYISENGKEER